MFYNMDYKTTYRCNSIHSLMINSKLALIAIAAVIGALVLAGANSAQAHNGYGPVGSYDNGNNYNNNGGGDPYNNNYGPTTIIITGRTVMDGTHINTDTS